MTDALDTKIRAFLVEIVDAAPSPPEFDAVEHTQLATVPRSTRSRVNVRSGLVAVGIVLAVVAAIGITIAATDDGKTNRVPAADSTTPTTSSALQPDECIVKSTGVLGCTASPEQATPLFGAVPRTPTRIPDGWSLARQDLRIYQTDEPALDGTGYFQLWAPDGSQPDSYGNYGQFIQLRQHVQQANETDPPECSNYSADPVLLANGSQACVSNVDGPTVAQPNNPDRFVATWIRNGLVFTLEGDSITRAAFDQTMNSIT